MRKRVFVCSPLSPTREFSFKENILLAERLCLAAVRAGYAPFAPHLLYTRFLDDAKHGDRKLGIECGVSWLAVTDELWIYAHEISDCSNGMLAEIDYAGRLLMPPLARWMPDAWKGVLARTRSISSMIEDQTVDNCPGGANQ